MFTSLFSRIVIVLGIIGASALTAATMKIGAVNYDVVVYGAGTSGFAAAIEAARLGSKVVLIEPTDWVGGQAVAAGVTSMDNSLYIDPATNRRELLVPDSGIYGEFIKKVRAYYTAKGLAVNTCYWEGANSAQVCFEPRVGRNIILNMLSAEPNITLMLGTDLSAVIRSGNTVTGVRTTNNTTINTKVFIDASEYGDGLKLARVPYRAGNTASSALDQKACIQSITYTANIKKYPDGQMPAALSITSEPPGYTPEIDAWFKRSVTNNGSNKSTELPVSWLYHNAYRGMPNSLTTPLVSYTALDLPKITRTSVNWVNDYPAVDPDPSKSSTISTDLPVTVQYLEDAAYRKKINCEAKLRTIQFIYYVQHGLGQKNWSVANDQGYNTTYNTTTNSCPNIPASLKAIERQLPVMPYVRESRRMVGMTTLTLSDLVRMDGNTLMNQNIPVSATYYPTSVAVGNYAADLHGCKSPASLENELGETSVPTGWVFTRFQIPFNAFIPQTIDGFIAAEKNISQSRLVSGSTRVQPTTTAIGQAAGAIAALAVRNGIRVRDVDPRQVAATLETVTKNNVPGPALSRFLYFDVPVTSPSYSAVEIVSGHNIMNGIGNSVFDLNSLTTRAQVVTVLEREFSWPLTYNGDRDAYQITLPKNPTFADVPASFWAYRAIEKAVLDKITNGCAVSPQMLFCPDDTITRAQLATFIVRASGLDLAKYGTPQNTFTDVAATSTLSWAYESVNAVVNAGIMTATNGTFNANGTVTRGDLAKAVARTISLPVKIP